MRAAQHQLANIVLRGTLSMSQGLFDAAQVLSQPTQNKFALFTARHFGAKQFEDERIGRLANSLDSCGGSLSFQATQASAIDERLWVVAYGSTTKLGNSVTRRAQNN
jgi:hypothetical protein